MKLIHSTIPAFFLLCLGANLFSAPLDFTRDVRPIFSENCFHCHGFDAKARKADLRLDDEKSTRQFIVPGKSGESELMARLRSEDPDEKMPPPDSHRILTQQQIETVAQWIDEGAKWGGHWSFSRVPETDVTKFGKGNPVDHFVDKKLKEEGITPNLRASKRTLIRRVALDLTGLPPTPEQVEAFLADDRPDAWERVVDQFLASPAYGERMAWDWLDVARYADTNGYQGDRERTMWPWRDWVVKAFNENMPYDQFTIWQLAGDLLPDATEEQILATAFNRNHMINGEGGRIAEENRVDYVFDMTETMGTAWLGLTLQCARCHDHKFDPLTQQEYYQMTAFFNQTPVNGGEKDPQAKPNLSVASPEQKAREKELSEQYAAAQKAQNTRAGELRSQQAQWEAGLSLKSDWVHLVPKSAKAREVDLTILPDHSVLATGANPRKETHVVQFEPELKKITAIRLDALQHESFTNKGKGLARSDSGNFVLTEFEVRSGGKRIGVASATASNEQSSSLKVTNAFDGKPQTGWAVLKSRMVDQPHHAIFVLKEPAHGPLEITLRHDSVHKHHFIGRFRLSATDSSNPADLGEDQELASALRVEPGKRSKAQKALLEKKHRSSDKAYRELATKVERMKKSLDQLRGSYPKVMVMEDMDKPRLSYILEGGLYSHRGEEVQAAVPGIFPKLPEADRPNRLALAKWLVNRDNPLTSRVTVNRVWQMLFGVGLVKTVEDFGVQAEYPVYPELFDWLAAEFMDSGWDVKHLLKTILLSEAYQRSSNIDSPKVYEVDPDNRLLARGPRYRLPSWMIRDQALAAAGLLNPEQGGPAFQAYQPPGIWEEATFGKKKYNQAKGEDLYRRSLYAFWRRIVGPTMFFDSGKRQICEVKIARTNTPMHALSTLNDVTYIEAARHLARNAFHASDEDAARLEYIGQRLLSRLPTKTELVIWKRSLARARKTFEKAPQDAEALLAMGDSPRDTSLPVAEHAAYSTVCLMLLNLDETLNKE